MRENRGSAKLWARVFDEDAPTKENLKNELAAASADFQIKRWWKYGQPAIDRIVAVIEVPFEKFGSTVHDIVKVHGSEIQVNLDVFPYGIVNPEVIRLDVTLERRGR
ncbi:MAG: hypothetical protein ABI954_13735 [Pyrinomonadaceae bacterium]